jgi:Cyclic nucleotide-binding domain
MQTTIFKEIECIKYSFSKTKNYICHYKKIMEELEKFLSEINLLEKKEIDHIVSKFELRKLNFKELFNSNANDVAFIHKGVFRVFYIDNDGNEITKFIFCEHNFIADINMFIDEKSTNTTYIQSVTKSEILVISKSNFQKMYQEVANWEAVVKYILTQSLYKKSAFLNKMLHATGINRYEDFIAYFPNTANRIPLSYVASFLGVTQQSLSRIRKNIS